MLHSAYPVNPRFVSSKVPNVDVWHVYMMVHQQDSDNPQQSHSSPQPQLKPFGLTIDETLEVMLDGGILAFGSCGRAYVRSG